MKKAPRLSLVHHANQYLLTEGYENRDGIGQVVQGYASVLQAHAAHEIPCGLHLSGTLIEAIAWSSPWFFTLVNKLREQNLIELIGGTYSENIMTLTPDESNRRQLREFFAVFEKHLGGASELKWFWVPERNWKSERFLPILQDPTLVNGGYRGVFLDHRLLFPTQTSSDSIIRSDVDALGPWQSSIEALSTQLEKWPESKRTKWLESHQMHSLNGLQVAPISEHLRYWIPLRNGDQERLLNLASICDDQTSLFFADDMERVAGVAGWDSTGLKRFGDFLDWAKHRSEFQISLPELSLKQKSVAEIEPGSFYELEKKWHAGSESQGLSEGSEAREALTFLNQSRKAVADLGSLGEPRLTELAWKHVLASEYETLWHDSIDSSDQKESQRLAPWAKALASHSRHALVMAEAAKWFAREDRKAELEHRDIDADGEREIILKNELLFAVFTPCNGARLISLFFFSPRGGMMMIGNPTDDWNWQSGLNVFMQIPANHPGAFCDEGGENDFYSLSEEIRNSERVGFCVTNRESKSSWFGTKKTFSLGSNSNCLFVNYDGAPVSAMVTVALSPDYLSLLREGANDALIKSVDNEFSVTRAGVNVRLSSAQDETQVEIQANGKIGHGWKARVTGMSRVMNLEIQCRIV